jgi:hypothetical protein
MVSRSIELKLLYYVFVTLIYICMYVCILEKSIGRLW